jgi:hypothetical protein
VDHLRKCAEACRRESLFDAHSTHGILVHSVAQPQCYSITWSAQVPAGADTAADRVAQAQVVDGASVRYPSRPPPNPHTHTHTHTHTHSTHAHTPSCPQPRRHVPLH